MNYAELFEYAKHFLSCCVEFLRQPHGIVILGVGITLLVVHFFEDLRR